MLDLESVSSHLQRRVNVLMAKRHIMSHGNQNGTYFMKTLARGGFSKKYGSL